MKLLYRLNSLSMLELSKTVVIIIYVVAKNVSTPVGSFSFLT